MFWRLFVWCLIVHTAAMQQHLYLCKSQAKLEIKCSYKCLQSKKRGSMLRKHICDLCYALKGVNF